MNSLNLDTKKIASFNPHVIFWTLFIAYEVAFSYSVTGQYSSGTDYITFYVLNIALFYLHTFIILKNSVDDNQLILRIITFSILEMLAYLTIKYGITSIYLWLGIYKTPNPPLVVFIRNSSWRAIYFMGLGSAYAYGRIAVVSRRKINELDKRRFQEELKTQQIEQSLLVSENAFLKAQINPHFIFNVLSFIHSTVSKYSEKGGDMIIAVSDLMRYALAETPADGKVLLSSELEHIENYIALSRQRYNNKLYLTLDVKGDVSGVKIIPLLFVSIIENVFKYGDLWNIDHPAIIYICVEHDNLLLTVQNAKIKRTGALSTGIGMSNVNKRLKYTYLDNYQIDIKQDAQNYELILNIKIPQNDLLHN